MMDTNQRALEAARQAIAAMEAEHPAMREAGVRLVIINEIRRARLQALEDVAAMIGARATNEELSDYIHSELLQVAKP